MSVIPRAAAESKREAPLGFFERYLTLWVLLCIGVGIVLGQTMPGVFAVLSLCSVAQVNLPVGLLIWVMIIPMLMKVDFGAARRAPPRAAASA